MNKQKKTAAALSYDQFSESAPKLTAHGKGFIAEDIIEIAKEHDVPIVEDPSLVELLSTLQINEKIPEELYEAVAEVFAFIYQLDQKNPSDNNKL